MISSEGRSGLRREVVAGTTEGRPVSAEYARNRDLILTPLGGDWSGRTRYAAAMYLHGCGELDAEVLEAYRVCARLDAEDPLSLIRDGGFGEAWLEKIDGWKKAQAAC